MKPINKTNLSNCPEGIYTSNCVTWTGADIPCIDLCTGDSVSQVVFKVAEKVCELYDDYTSLSELNFEDIVAALEVSAPTEFTLKALFQFLIDNDLKLKQLIDAIDTYTFSITDIDVTSLNLKCIAPDFTNCNDCDPDDIISILQRLIDKVCDNDSRITDLEDELVDIKTRLYDLENPTGTPEDCIPTSGLPVSEHVETVTDPRIDEIRAILGTDTNLEAGFSQICPADFTGSPGFYDAPTTLAETISSLWVALCAVNESHKECCTKTCSDVVIGYGTTYDSNTGVLSIIFNATYGNNVPTEFVDGGSSSITVTDAAGISATDTFVLSQSVTKTIDISALDATTEITIEVSYNVDNGTLTCESTTQTTLPQLITEDCPVGTQCWFFEVPRNRVTTTPGEIEDHWIYSSITDGLAPVTLTGNVNTWDCTGTCFQTPVIAAEFAAIPYVDSTKICPDVDAATIVENYGIMVTTTNINTTPVLTLIENNPAIGDGGNEITITGVLTADCLCPPDA